MFCVVLCGQCDGVLILSNICVSSLVSQSVYVTKIAPDGLAEKDTRLRLGDKLLSVSGRAGGRWGGVQ